MKWAALCSLVVAACGESRDRTIDAAIADAASDVLGPPTADAPVGAATIRVTIDGAVAPGIPVYFQAADSSLLVGVTTDAQGTAGAIVEPGAFVSVLQPLLGRVDIATFSDVHPGDALQLDLPPRRDESPITFRLLVDADARADVASYRALTSCGTLSIGAAGVAEEVTLFGCGGAADILIASINSFGDVLATHYHPDVALVENQLVTLTGTYDALGATAFTYTNVPPYATFLGAYQAVTTPRGLLFDTTTGVVPASATGAASVSTPTTTNTIALRSTTVFGSDSDLFEHLVMEWAPMTPAYTLDVGAALLPTYTGTPGYDIAAHAITWSEQTGSASPDVVRAQIHVYRDDIPEGRAWTWRVFAPRTGMKVALPTLPNDGFDFNPTTGDTITIRELTNADVPGGYTTAVREHGFIDFRTLVAGTSGRLVTIGLDDSDPADPRRQSATMTRARSTVRRR